MGEDAPSGAGAIPESDSFSWLMLIAIVLGTFVTVLNNSLINVALPKLVNVFGSTTETIQWVLTGYMLASAVVIPMSGTLGIKYGNKKIFVLSLAFFTMSSVLCGIAWSAGSLIFFRIVQGLSGGMIMPLGMAMIYMNVPRHKVGMALGLWGVAAMVAPAVGPTLSGYMIDHLGWRFLFLINIPIGIFATIMASILLKESPRKPEIKFDTAGAILSVIGFGSLLLALSKGQSEGWTSLYIVGLFYVAFSSLILLVYVELTKENPLLDFRLFVKYPVFTISTLAAGMVMMGMFGGVFLTPIYFQSLQGLSAIDTGLLLMPQSIAMAVMMPISGKLFDKVGALPLGLVGLTIMGITTFDLHNLASDTPNHWVATIMTIRGIGIGLCMMPLSTAGTNAIPVHLINKASPLSNVTRQVMGSFGISILTAVMTMRQTFHGAIINESVQQTSYSANQAVSMFTGLYTQAGLDAGNAAGAAMMALGGIIQKEAMIRAVGDTFLISAVPIFLSIPLVFFLRKRKNDQAGNSAPQAKPANGAPQASEMKKSVANSVDPEPVLSR